jgi:hypothetical protein
MSSYDREQGSSLWRSFVHRRDGGRQAAVSCCGCIASFASLCSSNSAVMVAFPSPQSGSNQKSAVSYSAEVISVGCAIHEKLRRRGLPARTRRPRFAQSLPSKHYLDLHGNFMGVER